MNKLILFSLCILSIVCSKAQTSPRTDTIVFSSFPKEQKLSFEPVFTVKNDYIRKIYLLDSSIMTWSVNEDREFFFRRYAMTGQRLPGGYIKAGRGYGAVGAPLSGGIHEHTFWLHDISSEKLVTANYGKTKTGFDTVLIKEYQLPEFYYSVELTGGEKMLGSGIYDSRYKLEEVDLEKGKTVRTFGSWTNAPADIQFNSWKSAYEAFLFIQPGGEKAVLACRYADQLEVFDLASHTSRVIKGPENYLPDVNPFYAGGKDLIERTADTRFAFVSGVTTKDFIYLLYSGNVEVEGAGNNNNRGKYIYMYDWEGRPVKKLILDRQINCFIVAGDNMIYAYDHTGEAVVKKMISQ